MTKLPILMLTYYNIIKDVSTGEQIDNEDLVFMYNTLATKFNEAIEEFENRNG